MPELKTKTYPKRNGNGSLVLLLVLVIICVAVLTSQIGFNILGVGGSLISPTIPPLPTTNLSQSNTSVTMESMQWFAVQVGAYATQDEAEAAALEAADRGGAGFIYKDGLYRVLLSSYQTQSEAEDVRVKVAVTYPSASIYKLRGDEILLSIVAAPLQASALSQGFALLPELVRELSRLSLALDRNTMSASSVKAAAVTNLARVDNLITNMEVNLSGSSHRLVTGLLDCLKTSKSALKKISEQPEAGLSSLLKFSQLEIMSGYLGFSSELAGFKTN